MNEEYSDLTSLNTYRIKASAKEVFYPQNELELIDKIKILKSNQTPWILLGKCSNVILPSTPFSGCVIKLDEIRHIDYFGDYVFVSAGMSLNEFVKDTIAKGYGNLADLYGIPGSVGGAIWANAGSYNTSIFTELESVLIYDFQEVKLINKNNIKHAYRYTEFKDQDVIILGGVFKLVKEDSHEVWAKIKSNLEKRVLSQPLEYPNAGSVFKNPPNQSAGKLIEECNLKGYRINGAMVSTKHANFIINVGDATQKDIVKLIDHIKQTVKTEKNIDLELEQKIIKW